MSTIDIETHLSDEDVERIAARVVAMMRDEIALPARDTGAEEWLTRKESANAIKVSLTTFDRMRRDGIIPEPCGCGRLARWKKSDLIKERTA